MLDYHGPWPQRPSPSPSSQGCQRGVYRTRRRCRTTLPGDVAHDLGQTGHELAAGLPTEQRGERAGQAHPVRAAHAVGHGLQRVLEVEPAHRQWGCRRAPPQRLERRHRESGGTASAWLDAARGAQGERPVEVRRENARVVLGPPLDLRPASPERLRRRDGLQRVFSAPHAPSPSHVCSLPSMVGVATAVSTGETACRRGERARTTRRTRAWTEGNGPVAGAQPPPATGRLPARPQRDRDRALSPGRAPDLPPAARPAAA